MCAAFATTFPWGETKTRNFPQQQQSPQSPAWAKPNIPWVKIRRKVRWLLSGENLERFHLEDPDIFSRGIKSIVEVPKELLSNMSSCTAGPPLLQCAVVWQLHEEEWGSKALKLLLRTHFTLTSRFDWHQDRTVLWIVTWAKTSEWILAQYMNFTEERSKRLVGRELWEECTRLPLLWTRAGQHLQVIHPKSKNVCGFCFSV